MNKHIPNYRSAMKKICYALIAGALLAACSTQKNGDPQPMPEPDTPKTYRLYVGTYTSGDSEGIYQYQFDTESGQLKQTGVTTGVTEPSFLTISADRKFLYAVNETVEFDGQPSGAVSAFAINADNGALTFLNQQATAGGAPCHLSIDKTGKMLLVANYVGGNIAVFPIGGDGKLAPASQVIQHEGSGPNERRQEAPHAHNIVFDAAENFAFATDLGIDKVMVYAVDKAAGQLSPVARFAAEVMPGAGPRHLALHPGGKFAYVIQELDNQITVMSYNNRNGSLKPLTTVSTLPADFSGRSYCADIHVHPNGKFLYGSNRGHNSIAVFTIAEDGGLTAIQHQAVGGDWPRNFTIDPTGNYLLVANQKSSNVVVFKIDQASGLLSETGTTADVPNPVCLVFVD